MRVRVLTYNAFECSDLQAVRALLADSDPDIICMQELIINSQCAWECNQVEWLANALGRHVVSMVTCRGFHRNVGCAIFTRRPILGMQKLVDYSGFPFGLAGVVEHHGKQLAFVGVHYHRVPRPILLGVLVSSFQRSAQVRRSWQWIRNRRLPGIIAGDFNALPHLPDYQALARHMTDCSRAVPVNHRGTRPTWGLPVQLDYVFASGHFRTTACETIDYAGSDHRPVLADLELPEMAPGASA